MAVCSEMNVCIMVVFLTSWSCSDSVCPTKVARQAWLLSGIEACYFSSGRSIMDFCEDERWALALGGDCSRTWDLSGLKQDHRQVAMLYRLSKE